MINMVGDTRVQLDGTDHLLLPAVGLMPTRSNALTMLITLCPVQVSPPAKAISDDTNE